MTLLNECQDIYYEIVLLNNILCMVWLLIIISLFFIIKNKSCDLREATHINKLYIKSIKALIN